MTVKGSFTQGVNVTDPEESVSSCDTQELHQGNERHRNV